MQALLNSPEAKLAILNALVSLGLALFVLVQGAYAQRYIGRLPLLANYYWALLLGFGVFTLAYIVRAMYYMGLLDPSVVHIAGSFILCFLYVAALQLYRHLSEARNWITRRHDSFPFVVGALGVALEIIVRRAEHVSPWFRSFFVAFLDASSLLALAWAFSFCREVSWLRNVVLVGLPVYGAVQFLGIPGYVARLDSNILWVAQHAYQFEFLAMVLAVLGKFVIAFGAVLVSHEFLVRRDRERLRTKEKFVTLGALTTTLVHRLKGKLALLYDEAREMKVAVDSGDAEGAAERSNKVMTMIEAALKQVKRLRDRDWSKVQPQLVDLRETVEAGGALILVPKNVKIVQEVSVDLPKVAGDAEVLAEVFAILMKNAVEAMPSGGEVRVRAISDAASGGWVTVRVEDSGTGIPAPIKELLFQPQQSQKPDGLGIGLWLARSYVELLGGRVEIEESTSGTGSTFLVALQTEIVSNADV
jgi:signal transduction histidine kinase